MEYIFIADARRVWAFKGYEKLGINPSNKRFDAKPI
jgi:hypothetical protein